MSVKWLRGSDIHKAKWDVCISHAFNGSVCGYSWYLDSVCWDWEALVMDDYQMVMPLPLCKIGGVKVVSNPFLHPFVTIYSQIIPSSDTIREFFVAIKEGRDIEPSWKKSIYKIINRLDEPIPDYFKDPNFLDRLE